MITTAIKYISFAWIAMVSIPTYCANVIFDLGGVLVETNIMEAVRQVGLMNIMSCGKKTRRLYFNYLDSLVPRTPGQPAVNDEEGNELPQLMCDWMNGARSNKEIRDLILSSAQSDEHLTKKERKVVESMTNMMFNPERFVKTKRLIERGIEFALDCKARGHKIYILSNWDAESFELFSNEYPELFNQFDGIMISGVIGKLKPNNDIYDHTISTFNLDRSKTVFIDDQDENIDAARRNGLHTIHCTRLGARSTRSKYRRVDREFTSLLSHINSPSPVKTA